jgi:hypothetical protein
VALSPPLDRIVNVHWGGGAFTAICAQEYVPRQPYSLFAWSSDGKKWSINSHFTAAENSLLQVAISGKDIIQAGGNWVETIEGFSGPIAIAHPLIASSSNRGATWQGTKLPDTTDNRNPVIGAIGFHKQSQTFYAASNYIDNEPDPSVWVVVLYRYSGGWNEIARVTTPTNDPKGLPLPPYPTGIELNDNLILTIGDESGSHLVVQTRPDIKYCSCNGPGQIMKTESNGSNVTVERDKNGKVKINGGSKFDCYSACAAAGLVMVLVGGGSNVINLRVSADAGASWQTVVTFDSSIPGTVAFS